jgi:hypothetical protein
MRKRLSYANVTATLALVFAMSGGAMAASHYLINSTKQINPKVLKKLTGKPGKTGAIGAAGATGAIGKEGPQGKEGLTGKEGKEGTHGTNGATNVVTRYTETAITAATAIYGDAKCEAGEKITGGGFGITGEAYDSSFVIRSGLSYADVQGGTPEGTWLAGVYSPTQTGTLRVWAICASP